MSLPSRSSTLSLEFKRGVVCRDAARKPPEQTMLLRHDGCDMTADGRNDSTASRDPPKAIDNIYATTRVGFLDLIILIFVVLLLVMM
mmetsp:Transcript_7727/g.12404  ORF Transcript_7727/g.12404 Transcript_7727/m.12404 type:complete len:87 (-) Transcript_7727:39-299(-)